MFIISKLGAISFPEHTGFQASSGNETELDTITQSTAKLDPKWRTGLFLSLSIGNFKYIWHTNMATTNPVLLKGHKKKETFFFELDGQNNFLS